MARPETESAEWIVEAPTSCIGVCGQLALSNFGRLQFTDVSAATLDHAGPAADPAWAPEAVEMSGAEGCRPFPTVLDGGRSIEVACA
jgi:hypothetical protein